MPYLGNSPVAGDHVNNFKVLDDISSHTATFDGSATSVVDTTNNTIRVVEHRFIQGQRVTYTNGGGGNIGGLTTGTAYFVIFDTASTFKLATSASNAANSTAINLSSVGTGNSHTLNAAFDGVNTKFKLTHGGGTGARLNNATQINVAINNVLQKPNADSLSYTEGFAIEDNHKIVFKVAPTSQDIFWGSIIANTLTTFDISDHKIDTFTGDGSTTEFTLSHTPANNESLMVTINGVLQHPSNASTARAYTLIASIIQFTAAPGVGDEIQVRHLGFAGATTADVSGFYGRTGNVVLTDQDDITVNKINVGTGVTIESNGQATFVGVVTFGSGSTTIDNNVVNVGTALTLGHTQGLQFHTQNLHSAGFEINQINASGIITASSLDISGNASIGGVLTYEDVTSIDAVGIITARGGLKVLGGGANIVGVVTATGADINGDLDVDGHTNLDNVSIAGVTTMSGNVNMGGGNLIFGDSGGDGDDKLVFGAGSDFKIFHNGSNNYIDVAGDGHLYIRPKANFYIQDYTNGEVWVDGTLNGSTRLYYNGGERVATTGGGVQVSGTFAELIFNASNGTGNQYKFRASGTNSKGFELVDVTLNQRAYLYHNSTYLGGVHHFHTNSTLRLAVEGSHVRLPNDNSRLRIGAGNDLDLYHDNNGDSYIYNNTGHLTIVNNTSGKIINLQPKSGANGIIARYEGAAELYHNNVKKLETQTNGVTVTGNVVSNHSNGQIILQASDGSIELTKTAGGAYIDFKNDTTEDYDARINEEGGHLRVNTHFRLYDNKALELGNRTSSNYGDLRLYHDATNSYIENHTGQLSLNNSGGNITIRATDTNADFILRVGGSTSSENAIVAVHHGEVVLSCNGATKLTTLTTGVNITGKLGVNESAPFAELDIASSVEDSNGSLGNHGIRLHHVGATDEEVIPITAGFVSQQARVRAGIGFISKQISGADGMGGAIGFYTRNTADGNALYTTDERVRIHENGKVTIGDSDATPAGQYGLLHLYQASNDPYMIIQRGAGDTGIDLGGIIFRNNTNAQAQIKSYQANINTANLHFYVNYSGNFADRFLMESTGTFSIQGNITDEKIVLANTSNPYIRFRESTTNKAYVQWNSGGWLGLYNQEDGSVLRIKDGLDFSKDGSTYYNVHHSDNSSDWGEQYTNYFVGTSGASTSVRDTEKTRFYKVTIYGVRNYAGGNDVRIMRAGVHTDNGIHGMWVGSMDVQIKFRPSNCGNGSNYSRVVHNYHSNTSSVTQGQGGGNIAKIRDYIACSESGALYVWLRGQLSYQITVNGRPATVASIDMNDYVTSMDSSIMPSGYDAESRDALSIYFGYQGQSGAGRKLYGTSGGVEAQGNVAATGSKPFKIPHPLVGLSTTKNLVHAAIEGPQCDNIYRGKTTLVAGISTVNIDTNAGMSEGTFATLNRDIQCFTTNETGWTPIKGSVSGNQLTILAQDNSCTDTISWMVVGERQDDNIINNTMTDSQGHLIVEPDFEEIVEPDNPGEFSPNTSQIDENGVDQTFVQPLSS